MDNLTIMETKLWEYIDGSTTAGERSEIEKLISENSTWRSKYQELLQLHQDIHQSELEAPSLRFTKNVMEEIARYQIAPATKKYINNKIIWGIGLFFITMILGFVIYGIGQIDWSTATNAENSWGIDLSKVDYSRMFNSTYMNIIMMMNIVLGLFLLDRYLNNKKKKLANQ